MKLEHAKVYRYEISPVDGATMIVEVDAAANAGNVTRLADLIPQWWWSGWCACQRCALLYQGILRVDHARARPPERLACPRCAAAEAVPEAHWHAAGRVSCACGYSWVEVYVDAVDILPQRLKCPECYGETEQIEPWPAEVL
jgi:hypothetical protein